MRLNSTNHDLDELRNWLIDHRHEPLPSMRELQERFQIKSKNSVIGLVNRMRAAELLPPTKNPRAKKENITVIKAAQKAIEAACDPHEPVGCRYIHGDVRFGEWRFCQKTQAADSSYCPEHKERCKSRYQRHRVAAEPELKAKQEAPV